MERSETWGPRKAGLLFGEKENPRSGESFAACGKNNERRVIRRGESNDENAG